MTTEEIIERLLQGEAFPDKYYQNPFIVAMSGYSGSGKSHTASLLSCQLDAVIISGDHVRKFLYGQKDSYAYEEIQKITNEVCDIRIKKLLNQKKAIILDRSVSSEEELEQLKAYHVPIFLIELISDHEQNVKRIIERKNHPVVTISPCYGDIVNESGMNSREVYEEVKARKVYNIKTEKFQYHIDARVSLFAQLDQVLKVSSDIKKIVS